MKALKSLFSMILVCALLGLLGCSSEPLQDKTQNQKADTSDKSNQGSKLGFDGETPLIDAFYQIPAPDELFAIVKNGKYKFKAALPQPPNNLFKFVDSKMQTLNFGVYSADLAYTAAFEQYQQSLIYFSLVRKLGDKIGISSVFDESLVKRIQNNLNNVDSLSNISNESYFRIIDYLVDIENGKTLTLIAVGGWVESIYIVSNMIEQYSIEGATTQRIADQKMTLENLIICVELFKDEPLFSTLYTQLFLLKDLFAKIDIQNQDNALTTVKKDDKIIIKGGSKLQISESQFNDLRVAVTALRTQITQATIK